MSRADEPNPSQAGGQRERRPSALRSANLAVRLLCELGLLIALAVWGFHTGSGAVIWGLWVAPTSQRRLADPARLVVEVLLFATGVAAFAAAGYLLVAAIFAVVVAANIILVRMLE